MKSITRNVMFIAALMSLFFISSCGDDDDGPTLSNAAEITSFVINSVNGTINASAGTITVDFTEVTDVTSLTPAIAVSTGASVAPASGVAQDFTNPVDYTVTAEDGTTQKTWTVTVNTPVLSTEAEITGFTIDGVSGTIDSGAGTVVVDMPDGTDKSALTPTIEISASANIAPASGVEQDFTNPVEYTVTAEDGTTQKVWTVTVTVPTFTLVITPKWEKTLANEGLPEWFTANNDRDVAIHGDYVYVHNNNDKIRVMSAADGSDVSAGVAGDAENPDLEFINGKQNFASGNLFLLGTHTDDNGVIVASNLRVTDDANPWNVYKWADKDSDQELLFGYVGAAGLRLGENLTVIGDVTGNALVYVPGGGFGTQNDKVLKFEISGGTFTGSGTNPAIIDLEGDEVMGNAPDVWPLSSDANSDILITGTGRAIAVYGQDGTKKDELNADLITAKPWLGSFVLDLGYFEVDGRKVIAGMSTEFTATNNATVGRLILIDVTDGLANASESDYYEVVFTVNGGIDTNFNGTGGVDFVVSQDGKTVTLVGLVTNFGVGVYDITVDIGKG